MRTSIKIVLLALTAMASWNTPSQAQLSVGPDLGSSVPWNVTINNTSNRGNSTTITIYDGNFNIVTTDCLAGGASRSYSGPNSGEVIYGIFIRYQIYGTMTGCQGTVLLDTSYGRELKAAAGAYPAQTVPAPFVGLSATNPLSSIPSLVASPAPASSTSP